MDTLEMKTAKFYDIMNDVSIRNQIIKSLNCVEYIKEAYPASLKLSEIYELLKDQLMKIDDTIKVKL